MDEAAAKEVMVGGRRMLATHWKWWFRSAVFGLLRFSGLPFLIREMRQRDKVTIVVYHALEAARADGHFAALRRRYNLMSLSDFLAARTGQTTERLPPKALIITI